jgi:predicted transcriptional regulator
MKRASDRIEALTLLLKLFQWKRIGGGSRCIQGLTDLLVHRRLSRAITVEIQAEASQLTILKALLHHIESGRLFAHEEHPFPVSEKRRDDIGDGLTLAGTWRTMDD